MDLEDRRNTITNLIIENGLKCTLCGETTNVMNFSKHMEECCILLSQIIYDMLKTKDPNKMLLESIQQKCADLEERYEKLQKKNKQLNELQDQIAKSVIESSKSLTESLKTEKIDNSKSFTLEQLELIGKNQNCIHLTPVNSIVKGRVCTHNSNGNQKYKIMVVVGHLKLLVCNLKHFNSQMDFYALFNWVEYNKSVNPQLFGKDTRQEPCKILHCKNITNERIKAKSPCFPQHIHSFCSLNCLRIYFQTTSATTWKEEVDKISKVFKIEDKKLLKEVDSPKSKSKEKNKAPSTDGEEKEKTNNKRQKISAQKETTTTQNKEIRSTRGKKINK